MNGKKDGDQFDKLDMSWVDIVIKKTASTNRWVWEKKQIFKLNFKKSKRY